MGLRKREGSGLGVQAPPAEVPGSMWLSDASVYSALKTGPCVQWAR